MSIYDSIAQDPFLQSAKYELEEIDTEIAKITRATPLTIEDKVRRDALLLKWGQLKGKYDRAIQAILNGEVS